MTRLTLGPLVLPLDPDEQRAYDRFVLFACVRGIPLVVIRDTTLGIVIATAFSPDPTPAQPVEA